MTTTTIPTKKGKGALLLAFILLIAMQGLIATQGFSQGTADWQLEKMPTDLESDFALSSLPPHLRNNATVYLLDPQKGYYVSQKGSNGYVCFVNRTDWEWAEFRPDLATPISFDAEGARTIFRAYFDVAAMRATGKFSAAQVTDSIKRGIISGVYQAPSKPGMSYMLAPLMRVYESSPPNNKIVTVNGPHYMPYAPYLTAEDVRYEPGTKGMIFGNPGESIVGVRKYPFGVFIVLSSASERAVIIEEGKDLLKRLAEYKDYFKTDSDTGEHHHGG
jgi:hypothetical protein